MLTPIFKLLYCEIYSTDSITVGGHPNFHLSLPSRTPWWMSRVFHWSSTYRTRLQKPPLGTQAWKPTSVSWCGAMESDRCEDTSAMLNYGLDVKPMRMVASPGTGPRHTIDNILGLARKDESERDRSATPGNGESAGEII